MAGLSAKEKTVISTRAAADKKALDLVVLNMSEASSITDYFLICSAGSNRQVQAIADAIDEQLGKQGVASLGVEGYREARWILMDYGDVIVHVFSQETREFYDLERLWGNAPKIDLDHEIEGVAPHLITPYVTTEYPAGQTMPPPPQVPPFREKGMGGSERLQDIEQVGSPSDRVRVGRES